jgi:hypothetical protein
MTSSCRELAGLRHANMLRVCPVFGIDRKWLAHGLNDAISGHRCRLVKIFPKRGLSPVKARH